MKKIIYLSIIASIAIFSSCGTNQPDQDEGIRIETSSENLNNDTQTGEGIQAGSEKHVCTEKCTAATVNVVMGVNVLQKALAQLPVR